MESFYSIILTIVLAVLCVWHIMRAYFAKDRALLWSPVTFLALSVIYYCVLPMYNTDRHFEGVDTSSYSLAFHIGALLSFVSILIGFYKIKPNATTNWTNWNTCINESNVKMIAIGLFVLALVCYVPVRGFKMNFLASSNEMVEYDWDNQGFNYYFAGMISLFVASCSLLLIKFKENKTLFFMLLWLTLVTYIVSGFRYRIIILGISMFTMYYLNNTEKRLKIIPVAVIAFVCFVGFNVMDHARAYGNGINMDAVSPLSREELTQQAGETERVYNFSIMVMDTYNDTGKRLYLDPILNAAFMPIPRVIFPWKPKAEYLYETTTYVMKGASGSAYVNFVEAFMSFGWLGIIINGLFIGWLARRFWNNYRNNPKSIGAILALAIFNGFTYVVISRGYMAQQYSIFIFFICFPFWLSMLINKITRIKSTR